MKHNDKSGYTKAIAEYLGTADEKVFLYWKGRVALFAILNAMGIGKDDEVIVPGFTCVVVPNAIKYLGAKPIYVDIDKQTLNARVETIARAITPKTKVIICQNTFGLSTDLFEITQLAKEKGIFTIEDRTHGFGGYYKGVRNGITCDASFFSTQWNKPYSTGIGGFAVINNPDLLSPVMEVNRQLHAPGLKEETILRILITARRTLLTPTTYWHLRRLYRKLSKTGLVPGSSDDAELTGTNMPDQYFKASGKAQAYRGIRALQKLDNMLARRKKNAETYTTFLRQNGKYHVDISLRYKDHAFLKYPILVKDRDAFELLAEEKGIMLDNWFCSPLHPITENFEKWDMQVDQLPVAKEVSSMIINLPMEISDTSAIINFLLENLDNII